MYLLLGKMEKRQPDAGEKRKGKIDKSQREKGI